MAPTNMNQEVNNNVTFMSFNSTGMNTVKCQFIHDIREINDVNYLAVQEHFKSNKTTEKFFSYL